MLHRRAWVLASLFRVALAVAVVAVVGGTGACSKTSRSVEGTRLREAAAADDLVALRALLEKKPEQEDLSDALVAAAARGKLAATRELLAAGASPARPSLTKGGIKPLLIASYGGHARVVDELLAKGAPVESENADMETALMVCGACETQALPDCERSSAEITKTLLARGANPKARDKSGRDALGAQALSGHEGAVEQLLAAGAALDQPDKDGQTALFHGAQSGSVATVRVLLAKQAAVDAKNRFGATPLVAAANKGDTAIVGVLLDAGASVETQTLDGITPMMAAATAGDHAKVVEALLVHKAPIEVRNQRGMNALHVAAASESERAEVVRVLLAHGADKDATVESSDPFNGMTPLIFTSMRGHAATATVLLEAGASMTKGPPRTAPALTFAATTGRLELVKLYVARGAPIEQPNPQGGTPLRAAADQGHLEVVRFLLSKGANPRARDSFGKLPIDYARENNHPDVAALLDKAP